jgi:hypothetical protein
LKSQPKAVIRRVHHQQGNGAGQICEPLMILDAGTAIEEVLGAAALAFTALFQSVFNQQGLAA